VKKRRFRVNVIPTLVSLSNFIFGFASITYSVKASALVATDKIGQREHFLYVAAMMIGFAMVADLLDGKIARMTGGDSAFGAEIDSLSDVVSFCVAPGILVATMVVGSRFRTEHAWILAAAYAAFGAMRLARYNSEKDVQPAERFAGLPTPAAAGAVMSLAMLYLGLRSTDLYLSKLRLAEHAEYIRLALPVVTLFVGVLMVTRVRYSHLGRKLLSGRKPFPHLVIVVLVFALGFVQLELTLAVGFWMYVLAGLVLELVAAVSGKPAAAAKQTQEAAQT
jgi:CDP-diacylglycerol--serine O-phosphatidyltransferase